MSDINLNALSLSELKEQCRILGLSTKGSAQTLRDSIEAALNGEELVEDAPAPTELKTAKSKDRKADWITIQIAEKEGDNQPVFVGHNGKAYFIRRGEPVDVPPHVVSVLRDALQMVRTNNGEWKQVPSYPFQVLS